jgi:hypothetical protein
MSFNQRFFLAKPYLAEESVYAISSYGWFSVAYLALDPTFSLRPDT